MSVKSQLVTFDGRFNMYRGGYLESVTLAYETWGELNDARDNAVLLFSGLSPSAHAKSSDADPSPGWWESMIGAGEPLDTDRYFVIAVNSLGSCFGSTGPASVDPSSGQPYRLSFPLLTMEDIAESTHLVVQYLGIEQLHAVVGCSMGGMSGLAYCVLHPEATRSFVSVSSCARALPYAIAVRSLQREMIYRDPKWERGQYEPADPPLTGQRLARKLGMMTYRSAEEWEQRFGRQLMAEPMESDTGFQIDFEVESYLQNHANKFSGAFDANCYLYLSRASDLFDVADHGGSLQAAFAQLDLETALVVGVSTDTLFPARQQAELAEHLSAVCKDTQYVPLDCIQGHDSFLVAMDQFKPVIGEFFAD
ncbi:MAG: homoserine O-acetyltransferase [Pseudomonadota bacterium]